MLEVSSSSLPGVPLSPSDAKSPAEPDSSSSLNSTDTAVLPDAPEPQQETQNPAPPQSPTAGTHINQIPLLPPALTRTPLTAHDKFEIYIHKTYGPPAVISPAIGAGIRMANPNSKYPREWKDGAGAYGRYYGDIVARVTSKNTAEFMTDVLLHEDPRYLRSTSTNAFGRTMHALAFTVVDRTDSGKSTIAVSHFTGAAAGAFVTMGYLPDGFNDVTHAEQRMATQLIGVAVGNILTEYEPQWGPFIRKLHIPKILPAWWVPQHPKQP